MSRFDFENMPALRPDFETAPDAAVGADRFCALDVRLAHGCFHFGELQNRPIAHFRFDALDHVDHAVQRGFGQRGKVAGFTQH